MTQQEDKKNQTRNLLTKRFKENADWQVAAVILLGLIFLAFKLLIGQ